MRVLMNASHSLWLAIASFFLSLFTTIRLSFRRQHPVQLVTNEEKSAPVSGAVEGGPTIMEMIRDKVPSLFGPEAVYRPTWWLPG